MWCIKYDAYQRIIFFLQTHLSKSVQKNMLKEWNFIKYKFCRRSCDNNLRKNFRTNILESDTAQILLIVVWMVRLCLDRNDSYLLSKRHLHLNFKSCVVYTCRGKFCTKFDTPNGAFANIFKLTLPFYSQSSIVDICRAQ